MIAAPYAAAVPPARSAVQALSLRLILWCLASGFVVIIEPAPSDLFFVLGLGVLMLAGGRNLFLPAPLHAHFGLLLAFVALNIVSLFVAHSFMFGLKYLLITVYLLLIPPVMAHFAFLMGRTALDRMHMAFTIGASISAVIGLMALLRVAPGPLTLYFRADDGLRLAPLFKDPNVYGPYMSAAGLLLVSRMCCEGAKLRSLGLGLAGFILLLMFLTFSRGAWLNSAVAGTVFIVCMLVFAGTWRQVKWVVILLAAACVLLLVGGPFVLGRLGLTDFFADRAQIQTYDANRFGNWAVALDVIRLEPLGIGPGHYVGRKNFPQSAFVLATHNVYLKVAVENGWFGFVTFFGAIGSLLAALFVSFFKRDTRQPVRIMLFAIILGQLANSVVVDSLHWRHFFVVLGFACGEIALVARERWVRRNPESEGRPG